METSVVNDNLHAFRLTEAFDRFPVSSFDEPFSFDAFYLVFVGPFMHRTTLDLGTLGLVIVHCEGALRPRVLEVVVEQN